MNIKNTKGFEQLSKEEELDFLSVTKKDSKGRIISQGFEVY